MADERLEWAQRYVARGWQVFLLGRSKSPLPNCVHCSPTHGGTCRKWEQCRHLTCHGFHAATTDLTRLEEMLQRHGDGMLAVATGQRSKLVALDAEGYGEPSGLEVLDHWEQITGTDWSPPMLTLTQRTGSGGLHLLYEYVDDAYIKSRRVAPKVDVKADGGYVAVAMGGGDGRHWENWQEDLVRLPVVMRDWLITTKGLGFGGSGDGGEPESYDFRAVFESGWVPDGVREAFFTHLSYKLRKTPGITREIAERQLRDWYENRTAQLGDGADWFMPWSDVEYKIARDWTNPALDPDPVPTWRPRLEDLAPGVVVSSSVNGGGGAGGSSQPPGDGGGPAEVSEPEPAAGGGEFTTLTDTGNALRLTRLLHGRVRYVPEEQRWYLWDGDRWAVDKLNEVMHLTREVIADIRGQAVAEPETQRRQELTRWALTSESVARRTAMIQAAESEPAVKVRLDELDRDPWQLVVRGGTLDLRTGELQKSRVEHLNTRIAAVQYDPTAECPLWEKHIEFVTQGDPLLRAYLQRACGYSLTGLVTEQKFFFLWGEGQNGKNVLVETILGLLGEYGAVAQAGLISSGDGEHPTALASLRGARLVMADETGQGKRMNDARIKMLTGSARVRARYMRQDFFEYDSSMKLWILGNNKPKISDSSAGMWRRMQLVPFVAQIPESMKILHYNEILREEWPGILNWCLEGVRDWLSLGGIGAPPAVTDAVAEYRDEEDVIGQFVEETLREAKSGESPLTTKTVYRLYQLWCANNGIPKHEVLTSVRLGTELARCKRFPIKSKNAKVEGKSARVYPGVTVADPALAWAAAQGDHV